MVIYDLCCMNQHRFEGWFANREDFEHQLEHGMIRCPLCESIDVYEKLAAPAVHVGRRTAALDAEKRRQQRLAGSEQPQTSAPTHERKGKHTEPTRDLAGEPSEGQIITRRDVTRLRAVTEAIQDFLEEHFEDVGCHFTTEAIAIFLGDAEQRNLRGTATPEEEAELVELGVPFSKIKLPEFDD